jgi:hypothetical protein
MYGNPKQHRDVRLGLKAFTVAMIRFWVLPISLITDGFVQITNCCYLALEKAAKLKLDKVKILNMQIDKYKNRY